MDKIYLDLTNKIDKTNSLICNPMTNNLSDIKIDKLLKKIENVEHNLNLININIKINEDDKLTNVLKDNYNNIYEKKLNYLMKKIDTVIDQNINLKKIIYILFQKQTENFDNIKEIINDNNLKYFDDELHDNISCNSSYSDKDIEI